MQANFFDSTILGAIFRGINRQGSTIAVAGTHRFAGLRKLAIQFVRCLCLCLGARYALVLQRVPAGTPATATCPSSTARRDQRRQRWMPGVVVDPGTVGDC